MDFDINREYQDTLTFVSPESPVSQWQNSQDGNVLPLKYRNGTAVAGLERDRSSV
jgi:hypothetical protein